LWAQRCVAFNVAAAANLDDRQVPCKHKYAYQAKHQQQLFSRIPAELKPAERSLVTAALLLSCRKQRSLIIKSSAASIAK
jgi:hypothetical protein